MLVVVLLAPVMLLAGGDSPSSVGSTQSQSMVKAQRPARNSVFTIGHAAATSCSSPSVNPDGKEAEVEGEEAEANELPVCRRSVRLACDSRASCAAMLSAWDPAVVFHRGRRVVGSTRAPCMYMNERVEKERM
jgi:hypothetical protein